MLKIFPKFSSNLLDTISKFSQQHLNIFPKFEMFFFKFHGRLPQNILKVSQYFFFNFIEDFLKIFSKFHNIFFKFSLKIFFTLSQNFLIIFSKLSYVNFCFKNFPKIFLLIFFPKFRWKFSQSRNFSKTRQKFS